MQAPNPRLPFFKFYPNDFLGTTALLPFAEAGLLVTLSALYWQQDGQLPEDDRIRALIGWRHAENSLDVAGLLDQFFPRDALGIRRSPALDNLREEALREHERNVMNGRQGGRKSAQARAGKTLQESPRASDNSDSAQF